MRFYTQQHKFYCGIDLHARTMYVCIMDNEGKVLTHKNMMTTAENLIEVIEPYRSDVVPAVECIFTWYWISRLVPSNRRQVRAGSRAVHESDPRRKGEERQDRLAEDSSHASGRDVPDGLRLSARDALNAGSDAP